MNVFICLLCVIVFIGFIVFIITFISSFIHHCPSNVVCPILFHAINGIISVDDCINDTVRNI